MSDLRVERHEGVVTVTFDRPAHRNAITRAMWDDLGRVLGEVEARPSDRALVLTGAGGAFSAGADLSAAATPAEERTDGGPPASVLRRMQAVNDVVRRLHRLPKPTLAVVDGPAVGVALGLAAACDLVLASERARFGSVFIRRGLGLDGGCSWSLPRQVGLRRAKRMALLGEMVPADDALAWGLVSEVVPVDELEAVARDWARRLAEGPTVALGLTKRLLDGHARSLDACLDDEAMAQHVLFATDDVREGLRAFGERRAPRFTGA